MVENWRECKLGDVATYRTGKLNSNAATKNGEYPFFTCSPATAKIDNFAFDEEALLLAGNNANGIFSLKYYKGKFNAYQRTYIINTEENYKFLFYSLKLQLANLVHISQGTATKFLTLPVLNSINISLPPLQEQKAIAEILSSLDDKIDLLHRQNHTLESIAQTLFRQWFIEEANPEWEEVKLGDYLIPKKGKNITKTQAIEGDYPVVAGGLEPSCYHNQSNTKSPVITISASGAAGFVRLYHTPVWASDCSYIDETITKYVYFFYTFLKYNQEVLINKQEGSVQQHIYPRHIMDLDILDYPINLIKEFENQARDIFSKIRKNQKQIQTLENLRDTLLPKLISGEVRVGT